MHRRLHAARRGEPAFDDVDDPAERDAGLLGIERGPGAGIREGGATARFPEQCFAIAHAEMDTTHPVGAKRSQPAHEFSQAVQVPQADGNRVGDLIAGNREQPGVVATALENRAYGEITSPHVRLGDAGARGQREDLRDRFADLRQSRRDALCAARLTALAEISAMSDGASICPAP